MKAAWTVATVLLSVSVASAQWLNYPTPGIPRTADGRPDLNAPTPQTTDGKPDLTGLWRVSSGFGYGGNIVADLAPEEILPWAEKQSRATLLNLGVDDPSSIGCLPRGPRYITGGANGVLAKFVQTPTLITILYEELAYRQSLVCGRDVAGLGRVAAPPRRTRVLAVRGWHPGRRCRRQCAPSNYAARRVWPWPSPISEQRAP